MYSTGMMKWMKTVKRRFEQHSRKATCLTRIGKAYVHYYAQNCNSKMHV
jgi:hypothetical protein